MGYLAVCAPVDADERLQVLGLTRGIEPLGCILLPDRPATLFPTREAAVKAIRRTRAMLERSNQRWFVQHKYGLMAVYEA